MEEDSTKKPRNTWTQRESSIETVNARYHPNHNTVSITYQYYPQLFLISTFYYHLQC
jgi:hypothetical protein